MAKISALTAAATLVGTEVLPVVQSAATVKATAANVAALAVTNDMATDTGSTTKAPTVAEVEAYVAANAGLPYKAYAALVTNSSGTFTVTELVNDFGATTFAFTNPSTGVVRVTASATTYTSGKAASPGSTINNAGAVYFMNGFRASDTIFTFNLRLNDGTQSATPNFTDVFFEIRVYN
jgi:hypothetical protein